MTAKQPPETTSTVTPPPSSSLKPKLPLPTTAARPPLPPSDSDLVHLPSYSRWFRWHEIHECEARLLPEFFESRSPSKNPRAYMYLRNSIIKHFRQNPSSKITFTDVRKTLLGDVGSIRRVFDFLEAWGLINYSPSPNNKPLKWDDSNNSSSNNNSNGNGNNNVNNKDSSNKSSNHSNANTNPNTPAAPDTAATPSNKDASSKRVCSGCKSLCAIACFACDKYDLTLCARCYVRGNYRVGVSSSDFRRVEISEETRTDWTEKETLQLLEAVMHFGDDWKKVAKHVTGRSEKDCIIQFIKLPFGEQFAGYADSGEADDKIDQMNGDNKLQIIDSSYPNKRMRLTPLADASNPIMAQAAFLSALVGTEISEAAARAAITTLTEVQFGASRVNLGSFARNSRQQANGDNSFSAKERACLDANSLLEKEEVDAEKAITTITQEQMKEIQDKIIHFEELDFQLEKEWQQLEQMKNQLFVDQLALLFQKSSTPKTGEITEQNVKTGS